MNYLIYLKNEGRRDATIVAKDFQLRRLVQLGADLGNPESVKQTIAALDKSESYKLLLCISYRVSQRKTEYPGLGQHTSSSTNFHSFHMRAKSML